MASKFAVPTLAVVTFVGTPFEGAEVTVRLNIQIRRVLGLGRSLGAGSALAPEDIDTMLELLANEIVVSWNLTDGDGVDLPPTLESVESLPLGMVVLIMQSWNEAMGLRGAPVANQEPLPSSPLVLASSNAIQSPTSDISILTGG